MPLPQKQIQEPITMPETPNPSEQSDSDVDLSTMAITKHRAMHLKASDLAQGMRSFTFKKQATVDTPQLSLQAASSLNAKLLVVLNDPAAPTVELFERIKSVSSEMSKGEVSALRVKVEWLLDQWNCREKLRGDILN